MEDRNVGLLPCSFTTTQLQAEAEMSSPGYLVTTAWILHVYLPVTSWPMKWRTFSQLPKQQHTFTTIFCSHGKRLLLTTCKMSTINVAKNAQYTIDTFPGRGSQFYGHGIRLSRARGPPASFSAVETRSLGQEQEGSVFIERRGGFSEEEGGSTGPRVSV